MRRSASWLPILCIASVGCGRFAYEPVAPRDVQGEDGGVAVGEAGVRDGAAGADAAGDVDAGIEDASADGAAPPDAGTADPCTGLTEGAPCDDRNVCTAESTCQDGACVPTAPLSSCRLADSQADFTDVQGSNGWWYGYAGSELDTGDYDPEAHFQPMAYASEVWKPDPDPDPNPWCYLAWWGGHPDGDPLKIPIRRWMSSVRGPARVTITHGAGDTSCGDGTRAMLFVDGTLVWSSNEGVAFTEAIDVDLDPGTILDVALHPLSGDECDTTEQQLLIESR